jgi:glycosyltransferase involved in cell wall biosynthesis
MKILYITTIPKERLPYNTPIYSRFIIFKKLGHDLLCMTQDASLKEITSININNMETIIFPRFHKDKFKNFIYLAKNISKFNFDLYIARDYPALLIAYFLNGKIIYDSCETWLGYYTRKNLKNKLKFLETKIFEGIAIKKVSGIITHSPYSANYLKKQYKLRQPIVTIPSIYTEPFIKNSENILKKELSLNEKDKLVISHGGLNPNRGLENLIKVFKYTPRNIKLVMMGNGILKQKLEQMISELGLKEKVYIIDEKPIGVYYRYVAFADLGIDIRDVENLNYKLALPIRIVDDIICGIPVAVPWDMEVAKLINNFGLGIVFKSREPIDIAKDICNFLNDNSAYDSIVKNVDVFRKTEFSLSNQVKIMSNFLDCIL